MNEGDDSHKLLFTEENKAQAEEKAYSQNPDERITLTHSAVFTETGKISSETLNNFSFYFQFVLFIVSLHTLIPQIIVLVTRGNTDYSVLFGKIWWVAIICLVVYLSLAIAIYIFKRAMIHEQSWLVIPLFLLFMISLLIMIVILSFYSPELVITLNAMLMIGLGLMLVMGFIKVLADKFWIKLLIIYTLVIIEFLCYFIFVKKRLVEFFILVLIVVLIFAYAMTQPAKMLIEFYKHYGLDISRGIPSLIFALSTMSSNVDILTCCFK